MKSAGLLLKLGAVLLVSFLLFVGLLVPLQYFETRAQVGRDFGGELDLNTRLVSLALAKPVYEYNSSMIESLLESFLVNDSIASIEVFDDAGKSLGRRGSEDSPGARDLLREAELDYQGETIGKVVLSFSPKTRAVVAGRVSRELRSQVPFTVLAALLAVCLISVILYRLVVRRIRAVDQALAEIARGDGDLARRLAVHSGDEIGSFSASFNTFVGKLREIVTRLKEAQGDLSSIGEALGRSVASTVAAAGQIAAEVDGAAGKARSEVEAVAQSSSAVIEIASNIENLERLIEHQAASVSQASASIEEMIGSIASVSASVEKMTGEFAELSRASESGKTLQAEAGQRIGGIAERSQALLEANEAIAAIASQTNLLAMNAAIEAAHAGAAGKGFAVVADEIRRLSETAAGQSQSIGRDLQAVTRSIEEVVSSSRASEAAFDLVAARIGATEALVKQVLFAMSEQREGSAQILEALSSMNGITAEVRAGAKEMSVGDRVILQEMAALKGSSQDILESLREASEGTRGIEAGARRVAEMAESTKATILKMEEAIGRFRV